MTNFKILFVKILYRNSLGNCNLKLKVFTITTVYFVNNKRSSFCLIILKLIVSNFNTKLFQTQFCLYFCTIFFLYKLYSRWYLNINFPYKSIVLSFNRIIYFLCECKPCFNKIYAISGEDHAVLCYVHGCLIFNCFKHCCCCCCLCLCFCIASCY